MIMKKLFTMLGVLLCGTMAYAQSEVITIEDVNMKPGTSETLYVKINEPTKYTAFQLDLKLPKGVKVDGVGMGGAGSEASTRELKNACIDEANNTYRFLAYDMENTKLGENTSLKITLNAAEDAESGTASGTGILFVDPEGESTTQETASANVTIPQSVKITIGANGKTTLVSAKDLDFTEVAGLKAYIATGYNQDTQEVAMTRVLDVPANTPIMLIGEPSGDNPYEVPVVTSHTYYPENYLKGNATSESTVDNSGKYLNLALKSGKFQPLTDDTFAEGKAYLQLPATIASAAGEDFSFTMGKNGKKLFVGKYDLDFTDVAELKAYIVTGYDKSGTIWLTRVSKTSAETPLYLVGTANKDFTVPSVATHSSYINMLKGDANNTTALTKEMDGYIVCILKSGIFQPLAEDDPEYPAGMSYLPIPKSFIVAASRGNVSNYQFGDVEAEVLKLNLSNGEATGINRIAAEAGNDTWYNLSGQRINTPTRKGLYIKNGKKIVVK